MKPLYLLFLFFVMLLNCKSNTSQSEIVGSYDAKKASHNTAVQSKTPSCVLNKIQAIKNGQVRNPPTVAKEFTLSGKRYYLIPSGCCDQFDYIIDENCKTFCSQGYGISGKYNNGCNALKNATQKIIWRDNRNQ